MNNNIWTRWITQRVQTSLAEANHYPHIVQYVQYALMKVVPWWWKAFGLLPKLLDQYLHLCLLLDYTTIIDFVLIYSSQKTQIATKI